MMIYSFELQTTGCHWQDQYALGPSGAAAPDAHWMAKPLKRKVVTVYALAPLVGLPAICQF